jgi:hypothetical protein
MKPIMVIVSFALCLVGPVWSNGSSALPAQQTEPAVAGQLERGSDDTGLLPWPFTAEQIRDEMVVGFEAMVSTRTQGREELLRWRVVAADDEGVGIEFTPVDAAGEPVGDSVVQHSGWIELRNHASFPAERSSRKRTVRQTQLGELDGWLYTIVDEEVGSVSEFFFALDYPGAPVHMRVVRNGETVMEMEQLTRSRPPQ